jgi:hypothetical protein
VSSVTTFGASVIAGKSTWVYRVVTRWEGIAAVAEGALVAEDSLEGCGVTTFAMTPANALVVGGTTLYFTEGTPPLGGGAVIGARLAGGTPTTLATYNYPVAGIATDGAYVYWAYGNLMGQYDGAVYAAPLGGGRAVACCRAPGARARP